MINKRCDKCDKLIEVEDRFAGQRVACGSCGDVNVMPAAGATQLTPSTNPADARTRNLGLPPDSGPEQPVLKVRPAMFRARPFRFIGLLLAILAGLAGVIIGLATTLAAGAGVVVAVVGGLVALVAIGILLAWKIETLGAALEITTKRTVYRTGLFSRRTSEVLHDNIRNVQVSQSFTQRLWNVGTLGISSSAQDGIEIEMRDVPRPEHVRKVVDAYRPLG